MQQQYSLRKSPAPSQRHSSTCHRPTCESKIPHPYYDRPSVILKDYTNQPQSTERRRYRRPQRRMFPQHVCVCDNNILGLPDRRSISPDGRLIMTVRETAAATARRGENERKTKQCSRRSRSMFNVTQEDLSVCRSEENAGFRGEKRPERFSAKKDRVRQMLCDKFRKIYEEQSPVAQKKRRSQGMAAPQRTMTTTRFRERPAAQHHNENIAPDRTGQRDIRQMLLTELQRVQTSRLRQSQMRMQNSVPDVSPRNLQSASYRKPRQTDLHTVRQKEEAEKCTHDPRYVCARCSRRHDAGQVFPLELA